MKCHGLIAAIVLCAALLAGAQRASARGCLAEDTPIFTPNGSVAIQNLKVGDAVWSIIDGRLTAAHVMAQYSVVADEIVEIAVAGRSLRVTPEHPMQIAPGVFLQASKLTTGNRLWLWDDGFFRPVPIDSIRASSVRLLAYNILVSPGGTYLADGIAVHNKGCFLPNTPILKADGTQPPIASIHPGDRLRAFTADGQIVTATVQQILTHDVDEYFTLATEQLSLDVTAEHPFFVGNGTFKTVEALRVGDTVYAYDGHALSPQVITSIQKIRSHVTVYNLQTDEPHTFFAHGLAVHNKGGGGHGGGGGHSSGGHSYGGGGRGGYGYGYGSTTRPWGNASAYICPLSIFILIILGVIYHALHRLPIFSSSPRQDLDFVYSRQVIDPKAIQTTKLLEYLSQQDPQVTPAALVNLTRTTFIQLQKCWEARNYSPMQPMLMPDLYRSHASQLAAMVSHHEIDHISQLNVTSVDLVHVRYTRDPSQREFTASITAIARDYYTDDRTGRFIRGDMAPAVFQEFWIFHLIGGKWLLRDIEQSRESDALRRINFVDNLDERQLHEIAGPAPRPVASSSAEARVMNKVSRVDALLDSLARRDPMWDRAAIISRARDVFILTMLAYESGDTSSADAEAFPVALAKLQARCKHQVEAGESIQYRNLCVRKVDVVLVQNQANKARSEFTARIVAHAQQVLMQGGNVIGQDDAELPFVQFLSFGWADGKWKLKDILSPGQGSAAMNSSNTSLSMSV